MVKNLPANAGDPASISGLEVPLEKEMATHSSILAWEVPWTEEPGGLQSMGSQESRTRFSGETAKLTNDNDIVKKSWKQEVAEGILWRCFYKMKMARNLPPITINLLI